MNTRHPVEPSQDGQPNAWADLWYFVMDEAPLEFERIVTTHSPARWHYEAHKLMRAKYPPAPGEAAAGVQSQDVRTLDSTPPDLSALLGEAREALAKLIALPAGQNELRLLRRGIGTATENAAWMQAEDLLARIDTVLNRPAQEPQK